jgi:glycosyltransferase involved in cell wall biosynthesis
VSVLVPTYDRAGYLGASLRSVLDQTFSDLEVVVVDDGSTDGTADVLARIADPRLRVVRQPHAGCAAALNGGLAVARGRYIARNDSDDVWLPNLLSELVPVLEANPALGLVYGRCQGMRADGAPSGATRGLPLRYPHDPFRSLLYADYTASIATVYRRSCLDLVGAYDATLVHSEDWDLVLRVARVFPVAFVDRVLARIRAHPGNATALGAVSTPARIKDRETVLDKVFARSDLAPAAWAMKPIAYRNVHIGNALQWWSISEYRRAGHSLAAALRSGANPAGTLLRAALSFGGWFGLSRYVATARLGHALLRWSRGCRRMPPARSPGPGQQSLGSA